MTTDNPNFADSFVDPYDAPAATSNDAWINGPDAVPASVPDPAPEVFTDPYAAPAPTGDDSWIHGPDAALTPAESAQSASDTGLSLNQLWDGSLPVQDWINSGLDWFVLHFRPLFQALRGPVDGLLGAVESALLLPPPWLMMLLLSLLAWQLTSGRMAIAMLFSLLLVGMLGIWNEAMVTLSLVLTSLFFCILIGLPLGVALARSDRAQKYLRPMLDAMQTTPAFVYLVPVVMLFGIGNVPGVIVTIIFALAPLVRLTNLGIRQVRPDLVEAARAYGASPWQLLTKVQMPLAMPSIMAGINQSLMLSLSMVVIASMIAVGGLGLMVLRGIGRLDMGLATVGGLGIVVLAIVLDRLTQSIGTNTRRGERWYARGPIGLLRRLVTPRTSAPALRPTLKEHA